MDVMTQIGDCMGTLIGQGVRKGMCFESKLRSVTSFCCLHYRENTRTPTFISPIDVYRYLFDFLETWTFKKLNRVEGDFLGISITLVIVQQGK